MLKKLDLSTSRIESCLFMILKYYRVNNADKDTAIKILHTQANKTKDSRKQTEGNNELDEKEEAYFRNRDYFIKILNNINYEYLKTDREHMKYLILNLLIYQPPQRSSSYTSSEIHKSGGYDENKNYMFLKTLAGKKRANYFVGKDKVSKTKNFSSIESKTIEINNKSVIEIIYKSIEDKPRKYVLELGGTPISENTLNKLLQEITKLKGITTNIFRSIYITAEYNKNITVNEKKQLAKQMRHDYKTAELNYFKLNTEANNNNNNKTDEENINKINQQKVTINNLNNEIDKLKQEILDLQKYKN